MGAKGGRVRHRVVRAEHGVLVGRMHRMRWPMPRKHMKNAFRLSRKAFFFVDQARELLLLDVAEAAPLDNEREPSVGTAGDKARLGEGDGLPVADALAREQDFAPLAGE